MKSVKDVLNDGEFNTKKFSKYSSSNKKDPRAADIFDFMDLINNWEKVVGPRLVQSTIPLKLKNKNLTVLTSHPVFAQQLSFMEVQMIQRIEESFPAIRGHVRKIYFQADNKHFQQKKHTQTTKTKVKEEYKQKWHKHSPQYIMLEKKAESLLSEVTDNELKDSLKSLYIQLIGNSDKK